MSDNSSPLRHDEQEIKEHIRQKVRTVDPDAPEWAEQVERIVDEVVAEFGYTDLHHRTILAEWVRGIATDEEASDG
jgi:hypothetical protein